jgi:hypothetical protein
MRIRLFVAITQLFAVCTISGQDSLVYVYGDKQFITSCDELKQVSADEFVFVFYKSLINPNNYYDSVLLGGTIISYRYNRANGSLEYIEEFNPRDTGNTPIYSASNSSRLAMPIKIQKELNGSFSYDYYISDLDFSAPLKVSLELDAIQLSFPNELLDLSYSLVSSDGNIFLNGFIGHYLSQRSFVAKFDQTGDLLAWDTINGFLNRGFYEYGNGKIALYSPKQGQLLVYDSSLTLDTTLSDVGIYNTFGNVSKSVSNQDRHIYFGNRLLFSGVQEYFINSQLDKDQWETISYLDMNSFQFDTIINIELPNGLNDGIESFTTVDTLGQFIYASNTLAENQICFFYGNYGGSFNCSNYVSLHKLDTNGVLYWSKYYGGDVGYFSNIVEATSDSGVILVVDRYDPSVDASENQYYIKLDKDGNQEADFFPNMDSLLMTTGFDHPDIDQDFSIFPNPFTDNLFIELDDFSGRASYVIIDVLGKMVDSNTLTKPTAQIDLSHLQSGVYILGIGSTWKRIVKE